MPLARALRARFPRTALEIIHGIRDARPAPLLLQRIMSGFVSGGGAIMAMIAVALIAYVFRPRAVLERVLPPSAFTS